MYKLAPFLSVLLIFINCKSEVSTPTNAAEVPKLGVIDIDVSGSAEAIPVFEEGLKLLHSFEFDDASEKFREAQEIDPDFAMAYWGEAMTENHPLWREQEFDKANEILNKLGETKDEKRAKFKTEFEKDLFDAVSILYGAGDKKERDQAYSDFMGTLHEKYPDNHEVAAFYGLSILGSVKGGRDLNKYGKGAKIVQSVIEENPNHPGALHYLIHSYDDPDNAPKALNAANSYAKIAPEAKHALHMPSHIYVALGMWDEVISSNVAAFAASEKRKAKKELGNDALDYHSLKWLMYGYLQKKDYTSAKKLVADMERYCYGEPSRRAMTHNVMMKAAYFEETGDWSDELVIDTLDYSDLSIQIFGTYSYMIGKHAINNGEGDKLSSIITELDNRIKKVANDLVVGNPMMCSGSYSRGRPTQLHVDRATVMKLELEALLAIRNNEQQKAENLMKEAVALEDATTYMYGPPDIVKPSHEMYADWLVEQGRYDDAKEHFEITLERSPKRLIALEGLARIKT